MARAEYVQELRQDIGYALRMLGRAPGFALVAVITLALGIGANSAIFSVVYGVLLQALPYRDAHQLMHVQTAYPNGEYYPLSAPDFMSIHDDNQVFSGVAAFTQFRRTLLGRGEPQEVEGAAVSRGFYELLGVAPQLGRVFGENEHVPGRNDVIIVSHGFWQSQLGGRGDVLGTRLSLSGRPYTVVGVLAPGDELPETAELYLPLAHDSTFSSTTSVTRRGEFLNVVARVRDGVSAEAAHADVQRIGTALQRAFPSTNQTLTFRARPLTETLFGAVRAPLFMLLGAVGFVLLVACANVANLLLARATARESELAVRAALGAGRGRLVRQLLTESLVLATAGAAAGLPIAWWATRALTNSQAVELPRLDEVGINGAVLLFTAAVTLLTGIGFGVLPALQASGARLIHALRDGGRGALSSGHGRRVRSALVVTELAFAVVLLVGAGLFIRSFLQLTRVDPGFDPEHAVSFRVSLQTAAYNDPQSRIQFFDRLIERLSALPGVSAVGAATGLPLTDAASMLSFAVDGAPPPPAGVFPEIRAVTVTPDYFRALGTQLIAGRMLTSQDRTDAPPVVLTNRAAI
ncbi:MAG TPA: ADOP family duplicated permease, partial [Longimicrobiales bacterium]|nr:ADOP family duplicated permease [Longimicrobiales bacterium]